MILSKNNILIKIENPKTPEYAILNPISGSFDLMGEHEYRILNNLSSMNFGYVSQEEKQFLDYLIERGYAFNNEKEHNDAFDKAYNEFNIELAQSQIQLMLVPTYSCNLACTYCFQHGIDGHVSLISEAAVDAFFNFAYTQFSDASQKPFITLFGGEPLVNSPAQRKIISYIVDKCAEEGYELAAVTNGYDFVHYIDILKKVKIKEIQFTLDGSKDVHDTRRATANKKGTFDRIIEGMDAAIKNKMPINLRSVVDLENIGDIIKLAEFLDKKGWLDLPPELFKTQIGRNYELFECYAKPQHLMTQAELWGKFASLSKEYPVLGKFHRPDFKGIRHLVDTGEMYMASFDTCPACKTEWVFDLYGKIYGCTASCGREEYLLGTFWPEVSLNNLAIDTWKTRDTKSIAKCRDCQYDAICGGGCGVVAANQHDGNILSPDCRPIQELLDIGVNYYIDEIKAMTEDDFSQVSPAPLKTQGCVFCGQELLYLSSPAIEKCGICGKVSETYARCTNGHYICDDCHRMDILEKAQQALFNSSETDPVILAQKVFELPGLNMHGPEYHSITPAVIVTAYQNLKGTKNFTKISEAVRRGRDVKGGSCGLHGNCGAGVGAGIAVSIIESATPMSKGERGQALQATARALLEISKHEGPRCCKREAITSIVSFLDGTDYFKGLDRSEYICRQHGKNKDCIGKNCSYFPVDNK